MREASVAGRRKCAANRLECRSPTERPTIAAAPLNGRCVSAAHHSSAVRGS